MVSTSGKQTYKRKDAAEVSLKETSDGAFRCYKPPNIPETEVLTGMTVDSADSMKEKQR